MPLSEAIAKFEAEEVCNRGGAKHQEDVPRRLALFLRAVGDKPIREISRDDVKAYRDLLDQAPDRFTLRFKTHDLREAIAANARLRQPFPTIIKVTIDLKYIGPVARAPHRVPCEGEVARSKPIDYNPVYTKAKRQR